ncbi:PRC-barrel domain-containing protein [Ideonella azotifigens]|uniref:PRC-barrel domain-containing protein n=1 Tax=Ideonella azotifigens TaxID=513160 RepID=A0ABP3V9K3_9BURK|nr:PRC-barrel domain-containing protein [Ideonella azotifigens]MCD2341221.1 PRC-barrel domain-containing protein [Ideonella azotifigens]
MLNSIRHITGAIMYGEDGRIGTVSGVLFDTRTWVIRYLAVDLEHEQRGRSILVSPRFIRRSFDRSNEIEVTLTHAQAAGSPSARQTRTLAEPNERDMLPRIEPGDRPRSAGPAAAAQPAAALDAHVCNSLEVNGCEVHALDDTVGEVRDFFFETETWRIAFLLVDTNGRGPGGRKVLLAPASVDKLDLVRGTVHVALTSEQVRGAPEYHEMLPDKVVA